MRALLLSLLSLLPVSGGEHRHFELSVSPGGRAATMHAYVFNSDHEVFQVIDQGELAGEPRLTLGDACNAAHATAGINGGPYDPQDQPLGLLIAGGKHSGTPSMTDGVTSGVVWSDGRRIGIARSAAFDFSLPGISQLLQAGPFLVEDSKAVSGLEAARFSRRTLLLTDGGSRWAIAFVPSATLHGLAEALARPGAFPPFQPKTVLNLDGGSSSGFWIDRENGQSFYLREISKVRNFLVVVRKNQG
jgi:hypothetical protein